MNVSIDETRFARLEAKVDAIWDFIVRRAASEAILKGIIGTPLYPRMPRTPVTPNPQSPIVVDVRTRALAEHMSGDLRAFYNLLPPNITDGEAMLAIEAKFGDRLLHEVCIPHGLFAGACLFIALDIAKGGEACDTE